MKKPFLCLSVSILLLLSTSAASQDLGADKKTLIRELLVIMDIKKNADAIRNALSVQIEKDVSAMLNRIIGQDTKLTKQEREELQQKVGENARKSRERFNRLFSERVNYPQLVEEVCYEVYDKYYTLDELRDLIAFYKTPVGQKTIRIMPDLFAESMAKTNERLQPRLEPLIKEIVEEETKAIQESLPKRTPAATTPKTQNKRQPK
ncbi:MAG TPA: DUF2059 domain-containing protein [Pyrinomonadaceae bacterium]